ncbi:hypothetical protein QR680_015517 [Steinernema hermaphroditum]|uniref:Activin types I and II receptor domain-containing protein n=1 Tax=Steinernema hermaphroditum TaxID=289476 RepID=A0AA39H915_9BILA|nr:hypothetical protein QR680_015517 [Steinernema hermaphroditum]
MAKPRISHYLATTVFIALFQYSETIRCHCFMSDCVWRSWKSDGQAFRQVHCEGNHCVLEVHSSLLKGQTCGNETIANDTCSEWNSSDFVFRKRVCRCTTDFCNTEQFMDEWDRKNPPTTTTESPEEIQRRQEQKAREETRRRKKIEEQERNNLMKACIVRLVRCVERLEGPQTPGITEEIERETRCNLMRRLKVLYLTAIILIALFQCCNTMKCHCVGIDCVLRSLKKNDPLWPLRCEGNHCVFEIYGPMKSQTCDDDSIENDTCTDWIGDRNKQYSFARRVCRCATEFCNTEQFMSEWDRRNPPTTTTEPPETIRRREEQKAREEARRQEQMNKEANGNLFVAFFTALNCHDHPELRIVLSRLRNTACESNRTVFVVILLHSSSDFYWKRFPNYKAHCSVMHGALNLTAVLLFALPIHVDSVLCHCSAPICTPLKLNSAERTRSRLCTGDHCVLEIQGTSYLQFCANNAIEIDRCTKWQRYQNQSAAKRTCQCSYDLCNDDFFVARWDRRTDKTPTTTASTILQEQKQRDIMNRLLKHFVIGVLALIATSALFMLCLVRCARCLSSMARASEDWQEQFPVEAHSETGHSANDTLLPQHAQFNMPTPSAPPEEAEDLPPSYDEVLRNLPY